MEVKVTFEDIDLETIVEEAVLNEIKRLTGLEVHKLFKDNHIDFMSLTNTINKTVDREVNRIVALKTSKLEETITKAIDKAVDREMDGIIRKKVAKVMSPYIKILQEEKQEIDEAQDKLQEELRQSAELETPAQNRAKYGIYG